MTSDLHHLSGAYAVDAVDDQERAAFEQHLTQCPDCRQEVAELRSTAALLDETVASQPPPALRAQILDAVKLVRPLPPPNVPGSESRDAPEAAVTEEGTDQLARRRALRRRPVVWLAAAAAAAVVVAGGLLLGPWRSSEPDAVQRIQAASDATTSEVTRQGTHVSVVRSKELSSAALIVSGLNKAPTGKTYQAWLMDSDQVMHPAGLLPAPKDGNSVLVLTGGTSQATAVGVTLEPAAGSAHPTSAPIVLLPLS